MVFPGDDEVIASLLLPVSMLIRLLFPTLLRPMKANSGSSLAGHWLILELLHTKVAVLTIMVGAFSDEAMIIEGEGFALKKTGKFYDYCKFNLLIEIELS